MNTNLIIAGIAFLVFVAAGAWYGLTHPMMNWGMKSDATTEQAAQADATAGNGTIASLWSMTGTVTCDIRSTNADAPFSGTVYVSGGNVRADVTSTIAAMGNQEVESHMIRTGGFLYTWTNFAPVGVKIAESETTSGGTQSQGMSASAEVSYTCSPWIADESKFVVPTNIQFTLAPTQ